MNKFYLRKVLKNNAQTLKYLNKLQKIYLIGFWANYGVQEYYFTGKYNKDNIPLVYNYYDANGTCDEYLLMPITHTTTGIIYGWTTCEKFAETAANKFRTLLEYDKLFYKTKTPDLGPEYSGQELISYLKQ